MAAVGIEQTGPAMTVAEQNQVFSQRPHGPGAITGRRSESDGLPVPPKELAARGPGTHMGELSVF